MAALLEAPSPPLLTLELKLSDFLGTAGNSLLIIHFVSLPPVLYEGICVFADIRRAPLYTVAVLSTVFVCRGPPHPRTLSTFELWVLFWGAVESSCCPGTVLNV